MLARRAIPQPATISKLVWRSARKSFHSSISRAYTQHVRPEGLWGKIRYRRGGEPRSRLVGAAFGSLIIFNALTLFTMSDFIDDSELALSLLASVIYIQQADMGFTQVDLQDPLATLTYFKTLYQAFSRVPVENVDELFQDLTRLMKLGGSNSAEGEAHRIMRTAAEQVHATFQNLNQDSISNTANYVLSVMREAIENLIALVQDTEDDDSDTRYTFQLIRDRSKKDPGSVLKDYESLG